MHEALAALHHPERHLRSVLVLGTNGKGSTAALLASILRAHGLCVGLYTSPHLLGVEERLQVDGTPIAPLRLQQLLEELEAFPRLSYFETLTVAAILEFAAREVDVAVLEAGLGGRWDATNAFPPAISLLTNVGTDHQAWLGPSRLHIAAEKAAALRGLEAIVGEWDGEVEGVIRSEATAPLTLASDWAEVAASDNARGEGTVRFAVAGARGAAHLPLAGAHQRANLCLALAGAAALARHALVPPLQAPRIAQGIEAVRWPGRWDRRPFRSGTLILDGAHNREAIAAVAAQLQRTTRGEVDLLFSCLSDKPLAAMAATLRPLVRRVLVAPLDSPRATPVATLAEAFPGCRVASSVAQALASLPPGTTTLVTGSLRLVGEVLSHVEASDA
jgi:dihydrofolate synthase/folylpolyglutamate synthase